MAARRRKRKSIDINVRLSSELHQLIKAHAREKGRRINHEIQDLLTLAFQIDRLRTLNSWVTWMDGRFRSLQMSAEALGETMHKLRGE
jgi:hypothetical protein